MLACYTQFRPRTSPCLARPAFSEPTPFFSSFAAWLRRLLHRNQTVHLLVICCAVLFAKCLRAPRLTGELHRGAAYYPPVLVLRVSSYKDPICRDCPSTPLSGCWGKSGLAAVRDILDLRLQKPSSATGRGSSN